MNERRPHSFLIIIAAVLLVFLAGCKPLPPRGLVYIVDDGLSTKAYYRPVVDPEGYLLGAAVELPFAHPVDLPAFTPEGDELWAWSVTPEGTPGLFSLSFEADGPADDAEPSLRVDLTPYPAPGASAVHPGPDGERVFFDALDPDSDSWQLYVYEDDAVTQLTDGAPSREIPVLTADGARLVFSTNDDGSGGRGDDYDLWYYNLADGGLHPLLETPGEQGSPHLAADGRLLFNSRAESSGDEPFYNLRITTEPLAEFFSKSLAEGEPLETEKLLDFPGLAIFPRPAADGALLFCGYADESWSAYLVAPGQCEARRLLPPDGPDVVYACWRPAPPEE